MDVDELVEKELDKILSRSELIRMAEKHFDSESIKEMIDELKEDILKKFKLK